LSEHAPFIKLKPRRALHRDGEGPLSRADALCFSRQRGLSREERRGGSLERSFRQQGRRDARVPGSQC
jgi:hypothetical protein